MDITINQFRQKLAQAESEIFAYIEQRTKILNKQTGMTVSSIFINFDNITPPDAPRQEYLISKVTINVDIR